MNPFTQKCDGISRSTAFFHFTRFSRCKAPCSRATSDVQTPARTGSATPPDTGSSSRSRHSKADTSSPPGSCNRTPEVSRRSFHFRRRSCSSPPSLPALPEHSPALPAAGFPGDSCSWRPEMRSPFHWARSTPPSLESAKPQLRFSILCGRRFPGSPYF